MALWKSRSLPPSWLADRTPAEIVTLFARPKDVVPRDESLLALLARANDQRAKQGLQPFVPTWLFKKRTG